MLLKIVIASPIANMAESAAVPIPIIGGIFSSPVANERIPVPTSARTHGNENIANAFTTAILFFPPLPSSLCESSDSEGSEVRR